MAAARALAHLWIGNFEAAEQDGRQGTELSPNIHTVHGIYGRVLIALGRLSTAFQELKRAVLLSPSPNPVSLLSLGVCCLLRDRHDDAVMVLEKYKQLFTDATNADLFLAAVAHAQGRHDVAVNRVSEILSDHPDLSVAQVLRSWPFRDPGDLLIVLSGLLYAADINLCKYVSDRLDSRRITQITSFASGGFALVLLIAFQIPFDLELDKIPTIIVISIIGTGVPTLMFLMALRRIGTVRTILLYSTSSIFGVIFSALFLSEEITFINIISIVIVMLGLYFLRKRLGKDENKDSADLKFKPLNAYKSKWNNMKLFCNFSWR